MRFVEDEGPRRARDGRCCPQHPRHNISATCVPYGDLEGSLVMFLQRKLRIGAVIMILGALVAATGEVINAQDMNVLDSSWRLSLAFIAAGMFILLVGLATFASVSDRVNGFGFVGSNLLILGGLFSIVGIAALDWIILPFLIRLANIIAATINGPATSTQDALNKVVTAINNLGGSVLSKLFPGSAPHISPAHIPLANGIALVNQALTELHLPSISQLFWWGHFTLSAGPLTLGALILGLALPRTARGGLSLTSIALVIFALLNLLCQFLTTIPLFFQNITAVALFLTLAWLGLSAWSARAPDTDLEDFVEVDTEYSER